MSIIQDPGDELELMYVLDSMTVHLGPVTPSLNIPGLEAQRGNGLDYNPRCLRRDISTYVSLTWTKTSDVLRLVQNYTEIGPFQDVMQGFSKEEHLGVHGGGHYTIGGDPGGVCTLPSPFYIYSTPYFVLTNEYRTCTSPPQTQLSTSTTE